MKKLILGLLLWAAPAFASNQLDSINIADYYAFPQWGSAVTAISDTPFSPLTDCSDIQFYTSLGGGTKIDHLTEHICEVFDSHRRGDYVRTWVIDGPDLPFSPLWCTDDPLWADYCGLRGNETVHVHTVNALGEVGHRTTSCVSTRRGAFCYY